MVDASFYTCVWSRCALLRALLLRSSGHRRGYDVTDDELAGLRHEVRYLTDHAATLDTIGSHARSCDRRGIDPATGTLHADSADEHDTEITNGPTRDSRLLGRYSTQGNISATQGQYRDPHCEIDGDVAHAETSVLVARLGPAGKTDILISGR